MGAGRAQGRIGTRVTTMKRAAFFVVMVMLLAGPAAGQSKLVGTLEELRARADQLFKEERYDEARDAYLQIQLQFTRDALLNRNLGTAYLRAAEPNARQAIRYWTISWQIDGDEDLRRLTAKTYSDIGQWAQGARVLTDLATEHPQHPEHWQEAGLAAERVRQYPSAITWYGRYLQRRPTDVATRLTRARLLGWEKRFDEAMQEYAVVLKSAPRNLEARLATAQLLAWQGATADSVARYDEILKEQPANLDAQRGKAFALLWMGRASDAKPLFEEVARRRRNDAEVKAALTDIAKMEETAPAAPAVPADPLADLRERIDIALRDGELAAARSLIDEALALAPQDVALRRRLAQVYLAANDIPGAISVLSALRAEQPRDADVLRELAWAQMRDTNLSAAADTLQALLDAHPGDRPARVDLARVMSWSRRFDEAERTYRDVLREDSSNIESLVGLAQLEAWQGRYEIALEQFAAILARAPEQREALIGQAQALYWVGRRDEAFEALANLQLRFPGDREISSLTSNLRTAARAETEGPSNPAITRATYRRGARREPERCRRAPRPRRSRVGRWTVRGRHRPLSKGARRARRRHRREVVAGACPEPDESLRRSGAGLRGGPRRRA